MSGISSQCPMNAMSHCLLALSIVEQKSITSLTSFQLYVPALLSLETSKSFSSFLEFELLTTM